MDLERFQSEILPMKDKLFRFAYSLLRNQEEAEDVVQEVLLKVWAKRAEWDQWRNMEAYCMRATRNTAIEMCRKRRPAFAAEPVMEAGGYHPGQITEARETMERFRQAILGLPEMQQMVLQLREGEGMAYSEIAAALGISLDAVKVTLFRARGALREKFSNEDLLWKS